MIRRIVEHNTLNGVHFSTIEFAVVAAAAAFIGLAFGLHHRWLGVALAEGVMLNCLVLVAVGVAAWRPGERGHSLRDLSRAGYREDLRRDHPTLMRDTLALSGPALVPYYLLVVVAIERIRGTD